MKEKRGSRARIFWVSWKKCERVLLYFFQGLSCLHTLTPSDPASLMYLARRCSAQTPSLAPAVRLRTSRGVLLTGQVASLHTASSTRSTVLSRPSHNALTRSPTVNRYFSSSPPHLSGPDPPHAEKHPISSLRNISIIAHIDAGKTTLTERLLHLTNALSPSSSTSHSLPGDVDSGSTVTDFLEQERQRGITIQSAAVGPVFWTPTSTPQSPIGITLVDTPGHIDFGIEVERALRVVDGAVVILDGVEGVESQTENVWSQAARYDVKSSILFINKLDRMGSSVAESSRSVVRSGMHKRPLLLQLPVPVEGNEPGLSGVVDLIEMQVLRFMGKAGEVVERRALGDGDELWTEAKEARHALVECLASLDDQLLEELFGIPTGSGEEPHSRMPPASLRQAIRRQTLAGTILPVLCGSAAKNIGVQPLLDAIADFLPSPADKADVVGTVSDGEGGSGKEVSVSLGDKRTTALAFKVVHDKRRGPTTFVRVYSGTLQRSTVLFNTTTGARERLSRVMFPFADQYTETSTLRAGQIGVILGLRDTRTGDTLVDVSSTPTSTKKAPGSLDPTEVKSLRLKRVHIPPPVFSMSLEPASKSDVDSVSEALNLLIRTDPSLRLDEAGAGGGSGQTVLSGMGELHLEIAKDRLANEFGVNARMGAVRVSYRETLSEAVGELEATEVVERELAGKKIKIGATMRVRALREEELSKADVATFGGNAVSIDLSSHDAGEVGGSKEGKGDIEAYLADAPKPSRKSPSTSATSTTLSLPTGMDLPTVETLFKSGLAAALSRGPLTSNPLTHLSVTISNIQLFGDLSSSAAISYLLSHLLRKLLRTAPKFDPSTGLTTSPAVALTSLMEPMMSTRILVPDAHLGKVISDITSEQDGVVEDVIHQTRKDDEERKGEGDGEVWIPSKGNRFELQSAAAKGEGGKEGGGAGGKAEIHAVVPLANLVRYSSKLRALTAGNAQFSMQLQGFAKVSAGRQGEILQELGR